MVWPIIMAAVQAKQSMDAEREAEEARQAAAKREDFQQRQRGAAGAVQSNASSLGARPYGTQAAGVLASEAARHRDAASSSRLRDSEKQRRMVSDVVGYMSEQVKAQDKKRLADEARQRAEANRARSAGPAAIEDEYADAATGGYAGSMSMEPTPGQFGTNPYDPRSGSAMAAAARSGQENRDVYGTTNPSATGAASPYGDQSVSLDDWLSKQTEDDPWYY